MYVSELIIENYRCFERLRVSFVEGLNVVIGENNAGKTALFKAMELLFNRQNRQRPTIDDFYRDPNVTDAPDKPPRMTITAILRQSSGDDEFGRALFFKWLTSLEEPVEATLTYCFYLPEKDEREFQEEVKNIHKEDDSVSLYWDLVKRYMPKYVSRIWGGNPDLMTRADPDYLNRISFDLLDAIRDVDSSMVTGRHGLLKGVLLRHLDFDEKDAETGTDCNKKFAAASKALVDNVRSRINLESVLRLAHRTGASMGGVPDISGTMDEGDIMSVMRLIVKNPAVDIPITHNGLGYNNLIYTSLVLADIRTRDQKRFGDNAKAFNILVIEEPEAHLHPAMQYKFVKFLNEETTGKEHLQQIFISTHSTHVTSAVNLDSIVVLARDNEGKIGAYYPGKVFSESQDDKCSKLYIERFLDATKSTLLFARGVILVEGIAEQLVLPCLADYLETPLEDSHITVVNVGGSAFKHFLKLFGVGVAKSRQKYALPYRVACLIDSDPSKCTDKGKRWRRCWPFEIPEDSISGEQSYKALSDTVKKLQQLVAKDNCMNVQVFVEETGKGCTFEYDLMYSNPHLDLLITDACVKQDELHSMLKRTGDILKLVEQFDTEIVYALKVSDWGDEERVHGAVAACYLKSIEKSKGEHALMIASNIREAMEKDREKEAETSFEIVVPLHIQEAIKWVTRTTGS